MPYRPGEKVVVKPNWVGMIWREGIVDPATYTFMKRQDYMNTSPQMVIAVLRQLVGAAGVREADISLCDSLAYLVHEYYGILHGVSPTSATWTTPASSAASRSSPRPCPAVLELPAGRQDARLRVRLHSPTRNT